MCRGTGTGAPLAAARGGDGAVHTGHSRRHGGLIRFVRCAASNERQIEDEQCGASSLFVSRQLRFELCLVVIVVRRWCDVQRPSQRPVHAAFLQRMSLPTGNVPQLLEYCQQVGADVGDAFRVLVQRPGGRSALRRSRAFRTRGGSADASSSGDSSAPLTC